MSASNQNPSNDAPNPFRDALKRVGAGAKNALDIMRKGRLGAPYRAPFDVLMVDEVFELRRYHPENADEGRPVVLMVPPLMVSSEIYDISPELSSVSFLAARGLDVWLVDYGNPHERQDGLERTLDDHILAVDRAIEEVVERTGRPIHLAGYSQGGMFCYQAAAYRRSQGIASLVTFGSPVDIRRNLPVEMHDDIAARLIKAAHRGISGPLEQLEGLPGWLTSRGFKLLNPGKEIQQIADFFGKLHDREALQDREPTRRFLGGEGFVAWPGEALREFLDEMVAGNRLASGGFVVADRTVSLADIDSPILYFMGARDDFARPAAVQAIESAAPEARAHGLTLPAGHFGLVVGSTALGHTWPTVIDWVHWRDGLRPEPPTLLEERPEDNPADEPDVEKRDAPVQTGGGDGDAGDEQRSGSSSRMLYDVATELIDGVWGRLGDVSREVGSLVDALRWQFPRFAQIESLDEDRRINMGRALAQQARAIPDETVFVWNGRAFSYAEADARVDRMAGALLEAGVGKGDRKQGDGEQGDGEQDDGEQDDETEPTHVGVLMDNHPDYLTVVAACSRIGAVPVLLNAGARGISLEQALEAGGVDHLVADGAHVDVAVSADGFDGPVAVVDLQPDQACPRGVLNFDEALRRAREADDPGLPDDFEPNPGRVGDLAMLIFTSGTTGLPKAARITNRRWALAALGTAAACEMTPSDTVYCALPLYHATGMLVAVGGALVGGARLALAPRFSASRFWEEVRRYGATVVFYVGEMCRYLVNAPERRGEAHNPVRLFVGNGLRPDVWQELERRFDPDRILEFYGSTEGNVCLANLTGEKVGSVGRPLPGTNDLALVDYDAATGQPVRNADGFLQRVDDDTETEGLLLARISDEHPLAHFDGYLDDRQTDHKVLHDAFFLGDAWFNTGDVLRRDGHGDWWFVDRVGDTFRWSGENVSTEQVAQVVRRVPFSRMAVVYGVQVPGYEGRAGAVAMVLDENADFDGDALFELVDEHLFPAARPRFVRLVDHIETTDSFKFVKTRLRDEGVHPGRIDDPVYVLDEAAETYRPMSDADWPPAL